MGGARMLPQHTAVVLTSALLTDVYQREVEVLAHPRTGTPRYCRFAEVTRGDMGR